METNMQKPFKGRYECSYRKYVALLRGINGSGKNKIVMSELKVLFESLGCNNVQTYIQNGNVIFESSAEQIQNNIETAIFKIFGFKVPVLVLNYSELKEIFETNPFIL
jgi:uncharacterized protein (DUF1697 family)